MALSVIEKLGGLDILINAAGNHFSIVDKSMLGLIFDGDILSTFP